MNIDKPDSQGRKETAIQRVGYPTVPLVSGQVLISGIGSRGRAVTPRPSDARTFASLGPRVKEST